MLCCMLLVLKGFHVGRRLVFRLQFVPLIMSFVDFAGSPPLSAFVVVAAVVDVVDVAASRVVIMLTPLLHPSRRECCVPAANND